MIKYLILNGSEGVDKLVINHESSPCINFSIMRALKLIDKSTWDHCIRVRDTSLILADEIRLTSKDKEILQKATLLHDIGKLLIPINILNKPGQLTNDEWVIMRKHSELGELIIRDDKNEYSEMNKAADIIRFHHEHYNGLGYPDGLIGENIPLLSRIICVVDVFDALMNCRPYRDAYNLTECLEIIGEMKGKQLDPKLTEIFIEKVLPKIL